MTAPQMPQAWVREPWVENETDLALKNFLAAARLDKRRILREARITTTSKEQTR